MKLEVRYLIDGQQVGTDEFERDKLDDLEALIESATHAMSECFSDLDYKPSMSLGEALKRARETPPKGTGVIDLEELRARYGKKENG